MQGALEPASACTIWEKTAAYVMRSSSCKNREDIDIEWHVCLGDMSVQLLQNAPESFPDPIIFASLFNCDSRKGQDKCPAQAKEVATHAAKFRLVYWCFCGQDQKETWTYHEERPSHQFGGGEWDKLAPMMISEFVISKHTVFKYSNILHSGVLVRRQKGGGAGTQKNGPENQSSRVREFDVGVYSTRSVVRSEKMNSEKGASSD